MLHSNVTVPRRGSGFDVVLTSSFDEDTLQHLLVSKTGMPLPPSMSKVDWMYCWGRHESDTWFAETLDTFAFYLKEKIEASERELVTEVITIKVKEQCHTAFNVTHLLGWSTYNEWMDWFNDKYENDTTNFFFLAQASIINKGTSMHQVAQK